jgi:hypothetical protein
MELSLTVTPYYVGGQRRDRIIEARKTNFEIIGKISWFRLVIDTGTGARLVLIPNAGIYLGIRGFRRWRGGTVRRRWDWILAHDEGLIEGESGTPRLTFESNGRRRCTNNVPTP